ncbi:MAG: hypothetical protein EXR71_12680 [Myxococcales bacterium]|nr:hypothetical protein [Myxococcales bacterium]
MPDGRAVTRSWLASAGLAPAVLGAATLVGLWSLSGLVSDRLGGRNDAPEVAPLVSEAQRASSAAPSLGLHAVRTEAGEVVVVPRGFGVIEFVVPAGATVTINEGRPTTVTGSRLVTLPVGRHSVRLHGARQTEDRSVEVTDGGAVRVEFDREGSLSSLW